MDPLTLRARQLLAVYKFFHSGWSDNQLASYAALDDEVARNTVVAYSTRLHTLQGIHANFWGDCEREKAVPDRSK